MPEYDFGLMEKTFGAKLTYKIQEFDKPLAIKNSVRNIKFKLKSSLRQKN